MTVAARAFIWLTRCRQWEPYRIYNMFRLGTLFIVVFGSLAVVVGVYQGLWSSTDSARFQKCFRCAEQGREYALRQEQIRRDIAISEQRIATFNQALTNPAVLSDVRPLLAAEQKFLQSQRDRLGIEPVQPFVPLLAMLPLVAILGLSVARLAGDHAFSVFGASSWSKASSATYWTCVAVIFVTHLSREVYTSVYQVKDKSWFAWSSFCISPVAWGLLLLVALGWAMVVSYPVTVLWEFGKADYRPRTLDAQHTDGQWGVGSYLLFLQTWCICSMVSALAPGLLWLRVLRDDPRFSTPYLLINLCVFLVSMAISARMIINAVVVRQTYGRCLRALGDTWDAIQAKKPPPDPTARFLGEDYWKLPAVIFGILAALWLLVQITGVSDLLQGAAGLHATN